MEKTGGKPMMKTCSKCGLGMIFKEGTNEKTGKHWQKWQCTNKECKEQGKDGKFYPTSEWINVPLTQAQEASEKPSLVKEFNKVVPPSVQIKDKAPDWDAKELRDYRGRCIMYACNTLTPRTNEDGQTSETRADEILLIAETKFLHYIYNGWTNERDSQ